MWIKKEGCETVNLDFVQSIKKVTPDNNSGDDDEDYDFCVKFYLRDDSYVLFPFDKEKHLDEYFEALMKLIGAEEVLLLKH